ncbi:hypothetical protein [Maritimibacter sp. UBA3975]|uniref:hypothetical protein n=1 Tax=Maritimibacter sp. UBA3975 TaxID=1946833 RepID=UPI000C0AD68E|nr:hypothetical protein [Maritimibacter sp. UBA3975]MAM63868.1 hypothetical protein [Maritimibacter sp.]|tara:strand:- start:66393 stop:67148 length:756 start_codon:yes stop_codon:yes gene_type:complete
MNLATNRRNLLAGLAAASTAVIGGAASARAPQTGEQNARLLELADELPIRKAAFLQAQEWVDRIYRETMAVWPLAPDEITCEASPFFGTLERDVAGRGIWRKGSENAMGVKTPEKLDEEVRWCAETLGRKHIRRHPDRVEDWESRLAEAKRGRKISERYFAECERLKAASGYEKANGEAATAREALRDIVAAIIEEEETSIEGVVVKAQALAAWGAVPSFYQTFSPGASKWGPKFADAVMRQARETKGVRT